MKFTKLHGCGNDYVYVNLFEETIENDDVKFSYFDLNQYKLAICSETEADEIFEYNLEDLY